MYGRASAALNRLPTTSPIVTAGFRWQPEMWPIPYAIVSTVKPKAKATPRNPIPRFGNAAASTALPQPPNTNQKVPMSSASARFAIGMSASFRSGCSAPADRALDRLDQRHLVEGLRQVLHRPTPPRTLSRDAVVVGGDEDDGNRRARAGEAFLQVQPAQAAEMDVHHEAIDGAGAHRHQELLGGGERLHAETGDLDEPAEGAQHCGVIV